MEQKYKIHACYILGILLAIIVALVTVRWGAISQLVEYIAFALTVTSLVLAVLAIVYSFISNSSLGGTLSAVGDASKDITEATAALRSELGSIPSAIRSVEGKIDAMAKTKEAESSEKPGEPVAASVAKKSLDEIANQFMAGSSIWGLLVMYACSLAFTKKIAFNLDNLIAAMGRVNQSYAQGFLVATASAGLVSYTQANSVFNITGLQERIVSGVRKELVGKVSALGKPEQQKSLNKVIENIDKFFGA